MSEIIVAFLFIFVAALVQGSLGFGFALIAVPFLSLLLSAYSTVFLVLLLGSLVNIVHIYKHRKSLVIRRLSLLCIFLIIGALLPLIFLSGLNESYLKIFVNIMVVIFSLLIFFNMQLPPYNLKSAQIIFGMGAGLVNTLTAINGPLLALFMQNLKLNKSEFLGTVSFLFLLTNSISITVILFARHTQLTIGLNWIIGGILLTILGILAGLKINKYLSERLFRRFILVLVFVAGILNLATV